MTIECSRCAACCCRLEVMLMGEDRVPERFVIRDRWGGEVMSRGEDGWCAALDRLTMRCTIYPVRPQVCRDYPTGGSDCRIERERWGLREDDP